MVAIIPVPSLSPAGWIKSPSEKIDTLLAHFFESMKSQTALYGNNVTSLADIVNKYGNNPIKLGTEIKLALETYLGRYYTSATVTVTNDDGPSNLNGVITLKLFAEVVDGGTTYSVGKLLETNNSKVTKITKLIN